VTQNQPALFREALRGRDYHSVCPVVFAWSSLSYRGLEEIKAYRGLAVDHATIWKL
jgi:transposase-like protein